MCLLFACSPQSVQNDAGEDGSFFDASHDGHAEAAPFDPDACAVCTTSLAALCASDASTPGVPCPPDLDSPALDDWARQSMSSYPYFQRYACGQTNSCPEMVTVMGGHLDTSTDFIFDAVTKKLVGIAGEGIGHVHCIASDGCLPFRCMSDSGIVAPSVLCPPMPDAGIVDASAE